MPSAIILLAEGTEEIEFVTPYNVLVRAGFDVKSIGVDLKESYATGNMSIKITPDTTTLPTTPTADILILPGGSDAAETFCTHAGVQSLIRAYRDCGKWVGVICASTTALVASVGGAGKTEGIESAKKVKVTSHPSAKQRVVDAGWEYSEERVVVDGKVISTRGPGTVLGFSLLVVELLVGKERRNEVHRGMVAADALRA
ncbi:class I glutamine amidotransferase-like protein [Microthyrium microscopicum]|uniref:D-lactate dehydratase n=1 Tax=Microthyrium microscopicum TaxID=703497 RepID=A0A6A6UCP7_9PEZI|nr:class I glutamine amidotransferase-like protein [Microthyrium microscopicum]